MLLLFPGASKGTFMIPQFCVSTFLTLLYPSFMWYLFLVPDVANQSSSLSWSCLLLVFPKRAQTSRRAVFVPWCGCVHVVSLWTSTKQMSLGLVLGTGKVAVVLGTAAESKGRAAMVGQAASMPWRASPEEGVGQLLPLSS